MKCLLILWLSVGINLCVAARTYEINSPGSRIRVVVDISNTVHYSVFFDGRLILEPSHINMIINDDLNLTGNLQVRKTSTRTVKEMIVSPVPEKRKFIPDYYNELTIRFRQPLSLIIRVYDDGLAYRFHSHLKDSITVKNEISEYRFPFNHSVYFSEVVKRENADIFHTSFEEPYQIKPLDSLSEKNLCFSPLLIEIGRAHV